MIRVVVVSGLSGSGKSTAIRSLEDLGFFCVDNLPPALLRTLLDLCRRLPADLPGVAVGMDVREGEFLDDVGDALDAVRSGGYEPEVLFLVASDEVLVRRYAETRRRHPLAAGASTVEGIAKERELLSNLASMANRVIDTTNTNVHDLRQAVRGLFEPGVSMAVRLVSFGFKHGLPRDASIVLDVRLLPNPYFERHLRDRDGMDEEVARFALGGDTTEELLDRLRDLLLFLIPRYEAGDRLSLSVAIGCTGGRHRSVATVEWLARALGEAGHEVSVEHRDVARGRE